MTGARALRFLTFRMDERLYALPAEDVSHVIRVPSVARVPRAPLALLGVANFRGSIIPIASLRGLLGVAEAEGFSASRAIVLNRAAPVAIAVDSVDAFVAIPADRLETRPIELAAATGEFLKGAFQADALVAKVLDIQRLLEAVFVRRERRHRQSQPRVASAKGERVETIDTEVLVTFDVADQEYALGVDAVREILPAPDSVAMVARAEALVVGMVAYRDELLPLLSLRGLLGFANAGERTGREKVMVTYVGGVLVGLVADRARSIVSAERRLIDPLPSLLAARTGGEAKIKAVYRGDSGRRLISILAPEQLFREDVMRRLASTNRPATPQMANGDNGVRAESKFVLFRLAEDEFALPIDAVDEVVRVPDHIARVPKTPKFLEGVVNVRGDILPIVDQRRRFEMPEAPVAKNRRVIVVRTAGHRAGLIVDSVSEVLSHPADAIDAAPDLTDEIARLVRGVINLKDKDRIVLVLDPSELLTQAERGLLDEFAPNSGLIAS